MSAGCESTIERIPSRIELLANELLGPTLNEALKDTLTDDAPASYILVSEGSRDTVLLYGRRRVLALMCKKFREVLSDSSAIPSSHQLSRMYLLKDDGLRFFFDADHQKVQARLDRAYEAHMSLPETEESKSMGYYPSGIGFPDWYDNFVKGTGDPRNTTDPENTASTERLEENNLTHLVVLTPVASAVEISSDPKRSKAFSFAHVDNLAFSFYEAAGWPSRDKSDVSHMFPYLKRVILPSAWRGPVEKTEAAHELNTHASISTRKTTPNVTLWDAVETVGNR
ncbi:uncharacterized protein MKK02DRAFT_37761 [Dioszegia hungarica]|uniref:Uncharacterized protein n=1 Tax=Dioszegia hungarica TaxID=4972 RepID=A0AA38H919_9TREE|nr:uncharacterized protein MKK02DRAFT_37761 [Dioszegia hungarica]KAI9634886.1 hypothetical protein MKK02DRAFT_37761 [Dioszegia hungarica]